MNSSAFSSRTSSIPSRTSSISPLSFSPLACAEVWAPAPASDPPPSPFFWVRFCSCSCGNASTSFRGGSPPIVGPAPRSAGKASGLEQVYQGRGIGGLAQQGLHVLAGALEGLAHRDPLERVSSDVEDDRVPRRRHDGVGIAADAVPSEERPRVLGGRGDGPVDLGLRDQALHLPGLRQSVVEALGPPDVVVLEVDQ